MNFKKYHSVTGIINNPAFFIKMSRLKQVPLLKLFILYSSGILIAKYLKYRVSTEVFLGIAAFSIMVLCFSIIFKNRFYPAYYISVIVAFISLGALSYVSYDETIHQNHFSHYIDTDLHKRHSFIAKINEVKKYATGKTKLIANIISIVNNADTINVSGSLLINTDIPYQSNPIASGDMIAFDTYISTIKPAQNPLAFDPKEYYHYQNIHYQSYLKSSGLKVLAKNKSLKTFFKNINLSLQKTIRKNIPNTTNANIAISILLGDKQNLDKELLNTFSITGIRHILTVSGMHVGIVALILNFIFSFIKAKGRFIKPLKIVTILASIWFYTLLTGAGSATLRAAFMISLLMIGINIRKNINTYNLLFGSALIILIINPYQLFQLGFILSYSAMLSILLFYPPVYNAINLKSVKILDYIWQLLSLSISAQILLIPLSIYYFHNAPSLFIMTAIISTPMAFLTIAIGFMIIFAASFSSAFALAFGHLLNLIITYCLVFIKYIESISYNFADLIYFEPLDLIIIFSIIALVYILLKYKIYRYGYYATIMILLLLTNQLFRSNKSTELVVYSSFKSCHIDVFTADRCYSVIGSNITENSIKYNAKNYRAFKNVSQEVIPEQFSGFIISRESNILEIEGKTVVLLESENDLLPANRETIDLLLLKDNIHFELKKLSKKFKINTIVMMKGMNYKTRKYWISQSQKMGIKYRDINERGAFVSKIKAI